MRIMVFDVPAVKGGALSILSSFYKDAKNYKDKSIQWIFVVSKPDLEETENIKVIKYPWIKKSWFHRLFFDYFIAPKLVSKYKVDKIVSLQNITIPNVNVPQIVYIHQSLPFVEYKFSFIENRRFWVYQNIIGKNIERSIYKADKVIVQTEWMKKACLEKTNVDSKKIIVIPPQLGIKIENYFNPTKESFSTFFYPAAAAKYKNHAVIIEACKLLQKKAITNYKVIFTVSGYENDHICKIRKEAELLQLPIEFVGFLKREQVFKMYTKSILLYPSYIETYGLPLAEAKMHRGFIIVSDLPFAHEVLSEYPNVEFFDPFNEKALAKVLYNKLNVQPNDTGYTFKLNKQKERNEFNIISEILE